MSTDRAYHFPLTSLAVAQRLLAHAQLCEQIARECWNEETAEKLRRMARDCVRTAAEVAPKPGTKPGSTPPTAH